MTIQVYEFHRFGPHQSSWPCDHCRDDAVGYLCTSEQSTYFICVTHLQQIVS